MNNFKRYDIMVDEGLSGIEVALEKRYDLLTKMLDTTKAYMKHESDIMEKTIELRKGMGAGDLNKAAEDMDKMQRQIFAVAENYPTLLSSNVFIELQNGIRDAENHLQAARRVYNVDVTRYNSAIVVFPASLLAGGRAPREFFNAEPSKREDVRMDFS